MSNDFPHGYALLIGVGACAHAGWSLPVTVKDVRALHQVLTNPQRCAYRDDDQHVRLLQDANATRVAILAGLDWLAERAAADPEATVFVYYSGHGWLDCNTGHYYLIPHDANPYHLTDSALAAASFTAALRQIQARRLLVVLDCCHAAGMATAKATSSLAAPSGFRPTTMPKALLAELKQGAGRAVFTSARGEQRAWVRPDQTLSIFTQHLLEALQGAANQAGDRAVRLSNLMNHLSRTVPASAERLCHAEQTPFFDTASEDFSVALLQSGKGAGPLSQWRPAPSTPPATATYTRVAGQRNIVTAGTLSQNIMILGDHVQLQSK